MNKTTIRNEVAQVQRALTRKGISVEPSQATEIKRLLVEIEQGKRDIGFYELSPFEQAQAERYMVEQVLLDLYGCFIGEAFPGFEYPVVSKQRASRKLLEVLEGFSEQEQGQGDSTND